MFLIPEKHSANLYPIRLYALGAPITVWVDDLLPLDEKALENNNEIKTFYMRISEDKAIWGPLLEKAYAKLIGNYQFLDGGFLGPAI